MMKKLLAAMVVVVALLTVATVASADHSWNGYHWPSDNLSPTVKDKTTSPLYDEGAVASVPAGVQEWADLAINDTDIRPTLTTAKKGDITITEAFSPFWLGLARIFVEDGHITKGEVKLNTRLLNSYPAAATDHVLCQEIGHVLGLNHNRDGAIGGTPDDSCMNDQGHLGEYTTPNQHDADHLNIIIYDGHPDATGGDDGGGGGGPPCDKNPGHPKCTSGNGVWITVHVFPVP